MSQPLLSVIAPLGVSIALASSMAHAASLTGPVGGANAGSSGYTSASVPSYVAMYEYVPSQLATNPPVLVVSHYYGATAADMFAIAQAGGLVAAADKYGFIMVFPQRNTGGCWDIGSHQSLTHDGGGETQAVAEMVRYEVAHRSANANRVYATGQSCGAMFTEALLAVYPDVFKAGAEFSGVPAGGCWTCSGGYVGHTPAEWGAIVDAMDPGYSGYRPRVQLWHGNADMTVNYQNQLEAIKEWTDVLGLSLTPNATTTLSFNGHMWTRETWRDACGFTLLDAFTEAGGPHNTDASEDAAYVVPFLGLDQPGATDPQAAHSCGADAGMGAGPADAAADSGRSDSGVADGSAEAAAGATAMAAPDAAGSSSSPGSRAGSSMPAGSTPEAGSTAPLLDSGAKASASQVSASAQGSSSAGLGGEPSTPGASGCSCRTAPGDRASGGGAAAIAALIAGASALLRRRPARSSRPQRP